MTVIQIAKELVVGSGFRAESVHAEMGNFEVCTLVRF